VPEPAVILGDYDEPEPDVIVRRGELRDYDRRKATAEDLALVVEVSLTSLLMDRGEKLRIYAAAGIPVYWIVNLNSRTIEVYTNPRGGDDPGYERREDRSEPDVIDPIIDGEVIVQVAVASLLPSPSAAGA
jgi:Uma2 family endonuclease